jgi:hypothetical protein
VSNAPHDPTDSTNDAIATVQRWRRSVVRHWIATMVAAIAVWGLLAATAVPWVVEAGAGTVLLILTGLSLWKMRRGRCPRCGARIRFEPRIELPRACPHCAISFVAPT